MERNILKIVTTSWDDGDALDNKVLDLLDKYDLKGTFYIQKKLWHKESSADLIKKISEVQEVGAHTLNHARLDKISPDAAYEEISGSKRYLEDIIDKKVEMFCYPGGFYNAEIKKMVKEVGFLGARTTKRFDICPPTDPFEWGTTAQIYPYPFSKKDKFLSKNILNPLKENFDGLRKYNLPLKAYFSWSGLIKAIFEVVNQNGGIFHLWGHSWEIEKYKMWSDLTAILKHISNRNDFKYLTNSQTLLSITKL